MGLSGESFRIQRFCCCGCTVKTGTLVLGILELIGGVVEAIQVGLSRPEEEAARQVWAGQVASCVVMILAAIPLLYGAYKDEKVFLLPWLVLRGISIVVLVIAAVVIFILTFVVGAYILLLAVVVMLLAAALSLYFWMCVWSFYCELSEGSSPPKYGA